jgi:hypothetical protein
LLPALMAGALFQSCSEEEETVTGLRVTLVEDVVLGYDVDEIWHYHELGDSTVSLGGDSLQAFASQTVCEAGVLYNQPARRVRERTDWHAWGQPLPLLGTTNVDLFYQDRDEALLLLAYSGASTLALALPGSFPVTPEAGVLWRGNTFRGLPRARATAKDLTTDDDLYLEDPPLVVCLYPLQVDAQWSYRQAGYPYRIDKRVTALGPADPDSLGERECVSTTWLFDLDRDGDWDEDIWMTTVSDARGVVTSQLEQRGLALTDEASGENWGATRRLTVRRVEDSTLDE